MVILLWFGIICIVWFEIMSASFGIRCFSFFCWVCVYCDITFALPPFLSHTHIIQCMEFWLCSLLLFIAVAVFFTSQAFQFYAVYKPNQIRNEKNNIMYAYPFQGLQSLIYIHLYTHRVNSSTYIHNVDDDDDDEQLSEHERTTSFYIIERTQHTTESATTAPAPATEQKTSEQEKHTRRERENQFSNVFQLLFMVLWQILFHLLEKKRVAYFFARLRHWVLFSLFPFQRQSVATHRNVVWFCFTQFNFESKSGVCLSLVFWFVYVMCVFMCVCNLQSLAFKSEYSPCQAHEHRFTTMDRINNEEPVST